MSSDFEQHARLLRMPDFHQTTLNTPTAATRADACDKASPVEEQQEQQQGEGVAGASPEYAHRLKAAFLDTVATAKRAPETLEEAMAVINGERAVKPDYGRAVGTVSAVRSCGGEAAAVASEALHCCPTVAACIVHHPTGFFFSQQLGSGEFWRRQTRLPCAPCPNRSCIYSSVC